MPMSHLLRVDPVVLGVRSHESDVDDPIRIVDLHHQPIVVALDVEHHAVAGDDARCPVLRLDLCGSIPVLLHNFAVPCEKRLLRVRVSLPKLSERLFRDDPHGKSYIAPISHASRVVPKLHGVKNKLDMTIKWLK